MHLVDYLIIAVYLVGVLGVGFWFYRRSQGVEGYFVGDRKMGAGHIGLSVVATDVGGGFSIGLGGVGYLIGLSGSWLLFTGLVGAWLAAVVLIPRVKPLGDRFGWLSFPDYLEYRFDGRVRLAAAVFSALGYAGFVGAQVLAGARLSTAAFGLDLTTAVWVMAIVVVVYTAFGGLKAVVYTDTVQWIILLTGLIALAVPFAWHHVGGLEGLRERLPEAHLSLTNVTAFQLAQWFVTIIPIWFVGMTLYQRIYATRDVRSAKRAWYLAAGLEYPVMAFTGALLGTISRAMFPGLEHHEAGLPMLIATVLPVGITGLVMASYFSAIMSTADSCLLASVGNLVGDIYQKYVAPGASERTVLRLTRLLTLVVGFGSVAIALSLPDVLDGILLAYALMASGLFVPTLAGLLWKRVDATAALWAALTGAGAALLLNLFPWLDPWGEPLFIALPLSAFVLVAATLTSSAD